MACSKHALGDDAIRKAEPPRLLNRSPEKGCLITLHYDLHRNVVLKITTTRMVAGSKQPTTQEVVVSCCWREEADG